uniref:Uncharacterized protein n=1 Tax=Setaria italica TaxID=4555 RepID=K3YXF3_SETIT
MLLFCKEYLWSGCLVITWKYKLTRKVLPRHPLTNISSWGMWEAGLSSRYQNTSNTRMFGFWMEGMLLS